MNQHNDWDDEDNEDPGGFDINEPPTPPIEQSQYAPHSHHAPRHQRHNYKADDQLVSSILIMLFCCQPLGIVSTVFSALAMSANSSGDYDTAHRQANTARKCNAWGLGLGLAYLVFVVIIMVISIAAGG
ncbi:CD225/dispanin family protein [Phycisphaeraceae bacterium D3-23]